MCDHRTAAMSLTLLFAMGVFARTTAAANVTMAYRTKMDRQEGSFSAINLRRIHV